MKPGVRIVTRSVIDQSALLPLAREMLGYSISRKADDSGLSNILHALACFAAFKDEQASTNEACLGLVSVGFLLAAYEEDMQEVLEALQDIEYSVTDTVKRGVQTAIAVGTLAQWQRVIKLSISRNLSHYAKQVFYGIYRCLVAEGLRPYFNDVKVCERADEYFLRLRDH